MILKKISLAHFRNFDEKTIAFHPQLTLILGPNSVGKTNILEALYVSQIGSGIKEEKQEELLQFGHDSSQIKTTIGTESDSIELALILHKTTSIQKKYFVNKVEKKFGQYTPYTLPLVFFAPQRIELLTNSPAQRRKLIDTILSTSDSHYRKHLTNYMSALTKRNKILERARDPQTIKDELTFWDDYLIEQAAYITVSRQGLIKDLNLHQPFTSHDLKLEYKQKPITHQTLIDTWPLQVRLRSTPVGPQREDFDFLIANTGLPSNTYFSAITYGSRSQQRLCLLWINLFELQLYKSALNKSPIFLLDDIFSELDEANKELVLSTISHYQTIITSNDEQLPKTMLPEYGVESI